MRVIEGYRIESRIKSTNILGTKDQNEHYDLYVHERLFERVIVVALEDHTFSKLLSIHV